MAKVAKKNVASKTKSLEVVNPNAAGIDISPKEMQVCVPNDRDVNNNRTFDAYTEDLHAISSWLKSCNIETIAMESTGVYWLPIFRVLLDDGFDVVLVNAYDVKNFTGRKTDASDAEWLMVLHRYGLLSGCYQLDNTLRVLRDLVRLRYTHVRDRARVVLRLEKAMEQMNLKLNNVFSDILGKSGQAIIHAILQGERNPQTLALLADSRCAKTTEEIEKSLVATWDEQHLFAMEQNDQLYKYYTQLIEKCDEKINEILAQYIEEGGIADAAKLELSGKKTKKKDKINFDVEKAAYEVWGVNIMKIPGFSEASTLKLLAELGRDFVTKFPTYKHFVSWANLVPNNKISGGALLSSKVPKKKNPVGIVFRECANALKSAKNPLGEYFRHMKSKGGHFYALVATGKKLATIFYKLVESKEEFDINRYTYNQRECLERKLIFMRRRMEKLEETLSAFN